MRGEFIGVWSETWQKIWLPLIDYENVSDDIFCELYRELATALTEPSGEAAIALTISDPIQLREAFDRALVLAGVEIDLARRKDVLDDSLAVSLDTSAKRRAALETALTSITGDGTIGKTVLSQALAELSSDPQKRAEAKERSVDSIINDKARSREAFEHVSANDLAGECALVAFLEATHEVLQDFGGDLLANRYFNLLAEFIDQFSLRYDVRRPCTLCPTLQGMFASLVRDLRVLTSQDAHLDVLMKEFENAVRDLRHDCSDGRIKTSIQKQVNLIEAIGRTVPGVTATNLGAICNQVGTWPHEKMREAIRNLYGFASDYPGIRHGGTPANALRAVDMRDMVAISILLAGFTPYLSAGLNADAVYRGT